MALVCGLPVNKAQSLANTQYLAGSSSSFLTALKDAIIDSVMVVANALKNWVFDYHNNNLKNDSLYLVYHMVISVFKSHYHLDLESKNIEQISNKEIEKRNKNFLKYAKEYYLNDVLTSYWIINRQVSDLAKSINDKSQLDKYICHIHKCIFEKNLKDYIEIQ